MMDSDSPASATLTAIAVMRDGVDYALCPFFGKCDGVLFVEPVKANVAFLANPDRTPESLSDLVTDSAAKRLICGYIPDAERKKLSAAGIDVRLGSCASAVDELIVEFSNLPMA